MNDLSMTDYQMAASETAIYPGSGKGVEDAINYTTLGLVGEAGELANKFKKVLRDRGGLADDDARSDMAAELGDVLWYVANLANELGFSLEEIAKSNLRKLKSRQARGVLSGSGDNR